VKGPTQAGRRRYALIWGWPTPVSELARTLMPPLPGRPSYCREARQWAKAMLEANKARNVRKRPKAERRWIGGYTLRWLRAVAKGTEPLKFGDYHRLRTYLNPPSVAPTKLVVQVAGGLRIGWQAPTPVEAPRGREPVPAAADGGGFVRAMR